MWRLLPFDGGASDEHFARSHALARVVETPTVWTHATDEPTLIVGPAQRQLDLRAARNSGVRVVHRQSGGTSVFAGPDVLGVDVAVPAGHSLAGTDVTESYRWLGQTWVQALTSLGANVEMISVAAARECGKVGTAVDEIMRLACFGMLSPYEVVSNGRKLVGLAQLRRRGGTLWQSGLHLRFDAAELLNLLPIAGRAAAADELQRRAIGLHELVPDTTLQEVVDSFLAALQARLCIELVPAGWTDAELSEAQNLRAR